MELQEIKTIGQTVERFLPYLNEGGCAIYTLALYRHLKKFHELVGDEKFVYSYSDYFIDAYKKNQRYLNKEANIIESCTHSFLFHNEMFVDSTGLVDSYYTQQMKHVIDVMWEESFLLNSINNPNWNYHFRRKTGIPVLERILEIDLSDVVIF